MGDGKRPSKTRRLKNKALNAYLDKIEYDLFSIAQTLQSEGKQVTAKAVTNRYRGFDKPQISFIDLCEEHNRMQSELVGKTVAAGTAIRYQTSLNHLKEFMQTQGKNDIYTDDITVEFLEKIRPFPTCNTETMQQYRGKIP